MIDEEYYVFPHEEPKHEPTDDEQRKSEDALAYLEALPFRPIGIEW